MSEKLSNSKKVKGGYLYYAHGGIMKAGHGRIGRTTSLSAAAILTMLQEQYGNSVKAMYVASTAPEASFTTLMDSHGGGNENSHGIVKGGVAMLKAALSDIEGGAVVKALPVAAPPKVKVTKAKKVVVEPPVKAKRPAAEKKKAEKSPAPAKKKNVKKSKVQVEEESDDEKVDETLGFGGDSDRDGASEEDEEISGEEEYDVMGEDGTEEEDENAEEEIVVKPKKKSKQH